MAIRSARGNTLVDSDDKEWLDLQSGILNTPFGHGSAAIGAALEEIIETGLINTYDRAGEAQEQLISMMSEYKPGYVWKPFNTGSEAIEKAIQVVATNLGKMPTIAVLPNSFHGKMLSMAWANYRDKLPWGNPLNLIWLDPTDADPDSSFPHFDALIYEPIHGWDGRVNDEDRLRTLCDQRGALLIADEMITSFMRCGKRFMSEEADLIVCGKGISAGVPLSMLGFKPSLLIEHNNTIATGWRSTGAGNNLSMVVGKTSLEMLVGSEPLIERIVYDIERRLREMAFMAVGAFGFKPLKNQAATKSYFEDQGIIGSWHCPPLLRVGPSFITTTGDMDRLYDALEAVDEL